MDAVLGLLMFLCAWAIYFVPSFVAYRRGHPQTNAIILTNFLLGWTFLGWCAALIWAATAFPRPREEEKPTFVLKPQKYDSRPLSSLIK
jgi:hypothetical protein